MGTLLKRLSNLLTIKSIVTLVLTTVFAVLALNGGISAEVVNNVYMVVIGFYFGTQLEKDSNISNKSE